MFEQFLKPSKHSEMKVIDLGINWSNRGNHFEQVKNVDSWLKMIIALQI